ncbi:MAG TPA: hypothetical protein VK879_22330 [Candidatus Sulfomarinibacteraceae bacterium]|nr:hypothetical protein [Candidatus Sulfomarinibacteraceae bacterium]
MFRTNLSRLLHSLGPIDARTVQRDEMLRWMILLPLVVALAIRWVVPLLVQRIDGWLPLDLAALYPPFMAYAALILVPFLWGTIGGFLLLDQRDDGTLLALQVTPLPAATFLAYRLLLPTLLSVASSALVLPLTGLLQLSPLQWFLAAVSAAPLAPLLALALSTLAQNKVQGLALMKASGLVMLPPWLAPFLPAAWQWPLALLPTYWPAQYLWRLDAGSSALFFLLAGLAYQGLLLGLLSRRFRRVMRR